MKRPIRILVVLAACFFAGTAILRADELTNISQELDFIESALIFSAELPQDSESYKATEQRLQNFHSRLIALQNQLSKLRYDGRSDFLRDSLELQEFLVHYGPRRRNEPRAPRLKRTGMGDYTKVFLRNLRNQNPGNRKNLPRTATLKNINLNSYCIWLEEIEQSNLNLVHRRNNLKSARKNKLEKYIRSITNLRKFVATLAKKTTGNNRIK